MTENQAPDPAQAGMVLVDRAVLERARHTAMLSTLKARIPECGYFGEIAQDLDALLSHAEPIPAPEGAQELPPLPPHPDARVFTWTSRELAAIKRYGEECARAALAAPAPQAPVPMTDAEIGDLYARWKDCDGASFADLMRAVERHHGITQTKEPTNDR